MNRHSGICWTWPSSTSKPDDTKISIATARKALAIDPGSSEAYNDISAASAGEEHWDAAIEAANSSLLLNPSYQLAKNNLQWAQHEKQVALQGVSEK